MPNWIEGTFRARGEKENIHNFLMSGLTPVDCMGGTIKTEKVISEEGDYFSVTFININGEEECYEGSLHINNTRRQFLEVDYGDIYIQEKKDKEIQFAVKFKGAWALDTDHLKEVATKYKIDIKVNGFECGMQFTQLFEVSRSGKIKSDSVIGYDDYLWNCDMCLLGG